MPNMSTVAAPTQPITPPSRPIVLPSLPSSASLLCCVYDRKEIDDTLLNQCARLFGKNYGIWGTNPTFTKAPKAGSSPLFLHLLNKTNQNSGSRSRCLMPNCMSSVWWSPTVPSLLSATNLPKAIMNLVGWSSSGMHLWQCGIMILVSVCHLWWTPSANVPL